MKKRYVLGVLALSACLAMAGCSSKKEAVSGKAEAVTDEVETEAGQTAAEMPTETAAEEKTAEVSGSGALNKNEEGLYEINNAEEFMTFVGLIEAEMIGNDVHGSGETSRESGGTLLADIDLSGIENFHPIGAYLPLPEEYEGIKTVYEGYFRGVFHGNGHTISGIHCDTTENETRNTGLFYNLWDAEVDGLTIKNSTITGTENVGAIAGTMQDSKVVDITIAEDVVVTGSMNAGGIAGYIVKWNTMPELDNCQNYGTVLSAKSAGGIVGQASDNFLMTNSNNYGHVKGQYNIGGIIGVNGGSSYYDGLVCGCNNYGTVTYQDMESDNSGPIGGIVGYNGGTLAFCVNAGVLENDSEEMTGPVVGRNNGSMNGCGFVGTLAITAEIYDPFDQLDFYFEQGEAHADPCYLNEVGEYVGLTEAELTDGSLVKNLNAHYETSEYWKQGEQFPVWSGLAYQS